MRKTVPLQVQNGFRQAGLERQMLQYLRPTESLSGRIVAWCTPPFAVEYPTVKRGGQLGVHLGVSDLGLNTWTLRSTGKDRSVKDHGLFGYDGIAGLRLSEAERVVKPVGAVRARTEAVILMKLWVGGHTELFFESRYGQARDQGLALQDAMLAAEARRKALRPSISTDEATLSGELAVLNNLFRSGALSTQEWERAKRAYLGERPDRRNDSLLTLNHLYRLYQTGALSDHEFSRKKLELLTW